MQVTLHVLAAVSGMALMTLAGARTSSRAAVPWQIAACVGYIAVGVGGLLGSDGLPTWSVYFLIGGGFGVLASVVLHGAKRRTLQQ
ncbi:hypothetical protein FBY24_0575 [Cellulomonas sp. SLBN-39]|nr:hypothetical protein FBY24_0575 [Cellulomonas sp. SLBN-39]